MKIAVPLFAFCALAGAIQGDVFQYDDSGRLYQATQGNGLIHTYASDPEGSLLAATCSSTDTTAGGGAGNGIADWWENYYFDTAGIDPLAESGDGIPVIMKFALGLDPWANSTAKMPAGFVEGGNMSFVFRKGKAAAGLGFVVQSSTDLATWTDLAAETAAALAQAPLAGLGDGDSDSYKVSVPKPGGKLFMRLEVYSP